MRSARCPRCHRTFPWGTTVCPACHVGLDLFDTNPPAAPSMLVFETTDEPSVHVVVGLLEGAGIPSLVRRTGDGVHGVAPGQFWRIFVRPADGERAQAVLDAEIGRGEEP